MSEPVYVTEMGRCAMCPRPATRPGGLCVECGEAAMAVVLNEPVPAGDRSMVGVIEAAGDIVFGLPEALEGLPATSEGNIQWG